MFDTANQLAGLVAQLLERNCGAEPGVRDMIADASVIQGILSGDRIANVIQRDLRGALGDAEGQAFFSEVTGATVPLLFERLLTAAMCAIALARQINDHAPSDNTLRMIRTVYTHVNQIGPVIGVDQTVWRQILEVLSRIHAALREGSMPVSEVLSSVHAEHPDIMEKILMGVASILGTVRGILEEVAPTN